MLHLASASIQSTGDHFHLFLALARLDDAIAAGKIAESARDSLYEELLGSAWGVVGLIAPKNIMWAYPKAYYKPTLQAAINFWEEFTQVRERYSVGSTEGQELWSVPNNIK